MALVRDMSKAQLAFEVVGLDIGKLQVMRFRGQEGLNQLYRFEIDMAAVDEGVALADIVGKPATLSINTAEGERFFHGIVSRFEMTGETRDQTYFRAELVPTAWLLTQRYNSRIFQDKTVKQIITAILTDAGIPADRFSTEGLPDIAFMRRENCVQYRETDFNFISRLCEDEGIWYFFEQSQDKHVLTFSWTPGSAVPIPGDPALRYIPPTGLNTEAEHVYRFRVAQSVRLGAVSLNDFNFKNPKLNLEAKFDGGRDAGLAFIDFPGGYEYQGVGESIAGIRFQEFEASRVVAIGQSNCKRLGPGKIFELKEHPTPGFNKKYFVTSVLHQGKESVARTTTGAGGRGSIIDGRVHQALVAARNNDNPVIRELAEGLLQVAGRFKAGDPTSNRALTGWLYHAGQVSKDLPSTAAASGGNPLEWLTIPNLISDIAQSSVVDFDAPVYDCRFECVPDTVTLRPPRVTPWPVMRGCQTARVVGPEGEEIQVDKFGRVRVQFHWDRQGSENGEPKLHGADSSCFIRVCQGWAGGQYGMMFIPRIGQEVVVDFLEGNPDNPIIIGRVFNADHMPPYPLPEHKTRSVIKTNSSKDGKGNNEIRFEDLKDKEQLFIQAQRQMDLRVKASHFHTVGGSYHLIVGGEYKGELSGEYRQKVFKAKHVHIRGEQRTLIDENDSFRVVENQFIDVGRSHRIAVGWDESMWVGKNQKTEVGLTSHLKATDVKIEATGTIELSSGGNSVVICPAGVYIVGTTVFINSGPGPTVPAVEGGEGPAAPEEPGAADSSEPGKDTRYTGPGLAPPPLPAIPEVPGHDFPPDTPPVTTFIDIKLIDKEGKPVPNEPFRVKDSAGQSHNGSLDENGFAHVDPVAPGDCEIRFPRRDLTVWRRAGAPA